MRYNTIEEEIKWGERKKVKVQLPNLLLDGIDCFISVPVSKVHVMTTYFKHQEFRGLLSRHDEITLASEL
jgi:hypothetical protein